MQTSKAALMLTGLSLGHSSELPMAEGGQVGKICIQHTGHGCKAIEHTRPHAQPYPMIPPSGDCLVPITSSIVIYPGTVLSFTAPTLAGVTHARLSPTWYSCSWYSTCRRDKGRGLGYACRTSMSDLCRLTTVGLSVFCRSSIGIMLGFSVARRVGLGSVEPQRGAQ